MDTDSIQITLDLGNVEMTLEELLQVRPGGTYSFSRPEKFAATLRIEGKPWAEALLEIGEDTIGIEIQSVGPQIRD